ncbi:MAG: trypsin-like peptidase domain-containing protein [Oscillospiraceae bacterium]|nr:trypsin-like peptidase domain-containing protein [Oscillospiraceae bacterium]
MFENNGMNNDTNDVFQQPGGSYYSPRSGYPGGGFQAPGNNDEPPKKKPHKGLKALAVFAGIGFLSYASIQCYQFAAENESIRSFLGKSAAVEEAESAQQEEKAETVTDSAPKTETQAENSVSEAEPMNFVEFASRENAMSLPDIVEKVTPATVGVASTFLYQDTSYSYGMFGFGQPQRIEQEMPATGTGIIMSKDGYIITNAHVIYDSSEQYHMGLAKEIQVVLNENYYEGDIKFDATVVGYDIAEDIAVLKINSTQDLTVAEFGNSDDLRVGELVVAIGNPLGFELFGSVTTGIVSALDREVTINDSTMRLIQTDTAINSGNSGGPLINSYGQVIGINSSKISSNYYSNSASVEGLCFAIPSSHAQKIINDLIQFGYVTGKPQIGISGVDIDETLSQRLGLPVGVYIREVESGSAAELAGLRAGDVIIGINGTTITNYEELKQAKDSYQAGDTITITVSRNNTDLDIQLILQEKIQSDTN